MRNCYVRNKSLLNHEAQLFRGADITKPRQYGKKFIKHLPKFNPKETMNSLMMKSNMPKNLRKIIQACSIDTAKLKLSRENRDEQGK
mmetsp:Transcript_33485/g.32948  ORF Transcript_33485/g.32948 Transcript_33485/m.32948 type:complete len:87 (+) Transcript_33485:418-678(+)